MQNKFVGCSRLSLGHCNIAGWEPRQVTTETRQKVAMGPRDGYLRHLHFSNVRGGRRLESSGDIP